MSEALFLRVEAVNLAATVYDTNDISTIRGSGFMLLDAVQQLEKTFFTGPGGGRILKPVTIGASIGLYEVVSETPLTPEDVVDWAKAELEAITGGLATFAVDAARLPIGEGFHSALQTLIARQRRQQFKQLTLPWKKERWKPGMLPCKANGVLTAGPQAAGDPTPADISSSVWTRKDNGIDKRKRAFKRICRDWTGTACIDPETLAFTDNLQELASDGPEKNLENKIAFIAIDGNAFGKLRETTCRTPELLKAFDEKVRKEVQANLFASLVGSFLQDPDARMDIKPTAETRTALNQEIKPDCKLRLETLLWGGDEFAWVVPAWKAFDLLRLFYDQDRNRKWKWKDRPLTYAAGVVFANVKTPIRSVRNLAEDLLYAAKASVRKGADGVPVSHEDGDLIRYLVLESIDQIEGGLGRFLTGYYTPATPASLLLGGCGLESFCGHMLTLKALLPHNKVYSVIDALRQGRDVAAAAVEALADCAPEARKQIQDAIQGITGGVDARWFCIADLWDFVRKPEQGTGAEA